MGYNHARIVTSVSIWRLNKVLKQEWQIASLVSYVLLSIATTNSCLLNCSKYSSNLLSNIFVADRKFHVQQFMKNMIADSTDLSVHIHCGPQSDNFDDNVDSLSLSSFCAGQRLSSASSISSCHWSSWSSCQSAGQWSS